MSSFKLSPEAFQDIEGIWDFIAEDNVDAADRVREESSVRARCLPRCREWVTFDKISPMNLFGSGPCTPT